MSCPTGDFGKYISEGTIGKKQQAAEFAYYDAANALVRHSIKKSELDPLQLKMTEALAKLEKHWPAIGQTIIFHLQSRLTNSVKRIGPSPGWHGFFWEGNWQVFSRDYF